MNASEQYKEERERRLSKDAVDKLTANITSCFPSPGSIHGGCFPSPSFPGPIGGPILTTTGMLNALPTIEPLTTEQRLDSLKKKITDYKNILSALTDASTKAFVNLLLSNIYTEVAEILDEVIKNRPKPDDSPKKETSTTIVPPYYDPYQPGIIFGPTHNPGITGPVYCGSDQMLAIGQGSITTLTNNESE